MSPVRCPPWCTDGDGHPDYIYAVDQWCGSEGHFVTFVNPSGEVDPFEQVGALARLDHNPDHTSVVLHVTTGDVDVDVDLSVAGARELAAAVLAAAELAECTAGTVSNLPPS